MLETKAGTVLEINENLLILQVLKQKIGPSGKWWPVHVDPSINDIAPMAFDEQEF